MGVMIPWVYASERRSNEKSEDVDLKRRLIYVRDAKFKKSRYVPISQSAADHLTSYCMMWAPMGQKAESRWRTCQNSEKSSWPFATTI